MVRNQVINVKPYWQLASDGVDEFALNTLQATNCCRLRGMVWSFAAVLVGALLVAFGVQQRLFKRNRHSGRIDAGTLSDSWLAEQRSQRDDRN